MRIMNISLTQELETFVNAKVKKGMYQSASEVVRAGLRLLAERDEIKNQRVNFAREIQIGLDQLKGGEKLTDKQLARHIKRRRKKHAR